MKRRQIHSAEDAEQLIASVTASANRSLAQLAQLGSDGLQALWSMKFRPVGCDPLDSESPLNLIEQINQSFTYIASAKAARLLIAAHPGLLPLTLNLGTSPGSDIESLESPGLAAEVFAAVNTSNNRKLAKDIVKVGKCAAAFRYVFFMCPGYAQGRQAQLEPGTGVQVWSVGESLYGSDGHEF